MKIAIWEYQDPSKQVSHFRGYVKEYVESTIIRHVCPTVRVNKSQARKDAEKLLKTLKKSHVKPE